MKIHEDTVISVHSGNLPSFLSMKARSQFKSLLGPADIPYCKASCSSAPFREKSKPYFVLIVIPVNGSVLLFGRPPQRYIVTFFWKMNSNM